MKFRLRNELTNFSNKDIILTHIASFMRQKNHIFVLDVLKNLPDKFKLYLGGPVESFEHKKNFNLVKEKITQLNLNNRVILFKGFVFNIEDYIKLSDIFLFPAWNEALGTPILEAQACGVPVVANFMLDTSDHWIKEAEGGYLVEKFDPKTWANKINLALKIDQKTLRKNSLDILNEASTKNIDNEYFRRFKSIL